MQNLSTHLMYIYVTVVTLCTVYTKEVLQHKWYTLQKTHFKYFVKYKIGWVHSFTSLNVNAGFSCWVFFFLARICIKMKVINVYLRQYFVGTTICDRCAKCNCIVVKLPLKFMFNEGDVHVPMMLSEFICTFLTLSRFNLLHLMMSKSLWKSIFHRSQA